MNINNIIERIITLNHAWKVARDDFGGKHAITESLRLQKSSWQATLLRDYPNAAFLKRDEENTQGEPLFSVRLTQPITINDSVRHDAEHIPERIAKHLFYKTELTKLVR